MTAPRRLAFRRVLEVAACSLLLGSCGAATANSAAGRPLPSYAGREAELFDDSIDPPSLGLSGPSSPKGDATVRERAQLADAVLRARVSEVTAKREDSGVSYVLGFRRIELLAGHHPPPEPFSVRIDKSNRSSGILGNLEGQMVGTVFVVFLRTYVRPDGDSELHFHAAPDAPELASAVREAAVLLEMKD